jgi:hypothetical protein
MTAADFVRELREEVAVHLAVSLPFLGRFAAGGLTRWRIRG